MNPSVLSAIAACLAAGAAWYANVAYAGRERREWQRTTVVKAAADVRDSYSLWHWTEDHRMPTASNRPNTAKELTALESELASLCNRIGLARAVLNSVGATALGPIADAAWSDLILVLYDLREFRLSHPNGGIYDGYRVCSLERLKYSESELDAAISVYTTTRAQRLRAKVARLRALPLCDKVILAFLIVSVGVLIVLVSLLWRSI